MDSDLFGKPHRRHVQELNIVPILDMMTTVIFFLLLSTSFIEFTKITVPPSATSTITDPVAPPPVTPKMLLMKKPEGYRLQLSWTGRTAGSLGRAYKVDPANPLDKDPVKAAEMESLALMKLAGEIVSEFGKTFPQEKTFQVGLSGPAPYQNLIGVMDGVQLGVGALVWNPTTGKYTAAENLNKGADSPSSANIVLISYAEVDAETSKSGEGID